MMEKTQTKQTEPHLQRFERFEQAAQQPSWLLPLRQAGMARFAERGFPTLQDEDWRFTNVAPIAKLPFKPVVSASPDAPGKEQVAGFTFGSLPALRLVFVNGHLAPALSSGTPVAGLTACSLAAALAEGSGLIEKHLGQLSESEKNPFTALNTAFFQDGGFVHVARGTAVEQPVHLLFVSTLKENGSTVSPRNLIIAEPGSRVTVLESYVSTADAAYLTNAVTEIIALDDSAVEHCKYQEESAQAFHTAAIHARMGRNANVVAHSIALGARISRNDIRTTLAAEGVECILNGLYLTRGDQLADHHMVVEHAQPHCNSHEYYNGILDGRSKGVFHGRILVRQPAQKTDAKQTNKNLLLSEEATIDTKPQLEIYADDVKCTHGATVGQLDDESVFYLRSRGIGADRARRMLIHAFAGEIIDRVRNAAVREELNRIVWNRLETNPQVAETAGLPCLTS